MTNNSLTELLARYHQNAPLAEAYTIPAAWYVDERVARVEHDNVFGGNWLAVGRTDQVFAPGQFFTFDLDGEPLIIVRGADNVLRVWDGVSRTRLFQASLAVAASPGQRADT